MQTELLDSAFAMASQSIHCHHPINALPPNLAMDMAVLDRQAAGLRWQQLNPTTVGSQADGQQLLDHFSLPAEMFLGTSEAAQESREVLMREQTDIIATTTTTTDVDVASMTCGWAEMTQHQMTNHRLQPSFAAGPFTTATESKPFSSLARTTSCPPAMGSLLSSAARMGLRSCKILSSPLSGDGLRKRKTLRNEVLAAPPTPKQVEGSKSIKGEILEADELGPDTEKAGGESSGNGGKENAKGGAAPANNIPKPDYIHVRARRGQATDSHSLAERVRREKISERMKLLQDLVPGCNKITGKAGMLDEIINYVQSLQRQVEFLSMKLAAVSPKSEGSSGDSYIGKEAFPLCHSNFPGVGMPLEVAPPSYVHLNMMQSATATSIQQQQGGGGGGGRMDIPMNNNFSGMTTLRRTTSAPVTITDDFIDSCFPDSSLPFNPTWDLDLQSLYTMDLHQQPRQQQPAFAPQTSFVAAGHSEMHNVKMEMM